MAARDAFDPDGKGQVPVAILPERKIVSVGRNLAIEQERSGAAWTLEWLLLPQMAVATAAALRLAAELTGQIESLGH